MNINKNLPNMSSTITKWFLNITFQEVIRTLDGADWEETLGQIYNTRGVVQPTKDTELTIYPMGCWAWRWLTVHCLPNLKLKPNQYVKYNDITYKVMAVKDWSSYGYMRYLLLEAFDADKL